MFCVTRRCRGTRRRRVQVFKSHLDQRYSGVQRVSSHDGRSVDAVPIDSATELMRLVRSDTEVVAVDEVQFLEPVSWRPSPRWPPAARRVILAGTDTDFRGEPFGAMGALMAIAEEVEKLRAICTICGDDACRNQRLVDGQPAPWDAPIIQVGGSESYDARCRHCHRVPRRDEDQTALL